MPDSAIDDTEDMVYEDPLDGFDSDILNQSDDELVDLTPAQIQAKAEEDAPSRRLGADDESDTDKEAAKIADEMVDDDPEEPLLSDGDEKAQEITNKVNAEAEELSSAESESNDEEDSASAKAESDESDKESKKEAHKAPLKDDVNYKQEYEKLLAPFKANGRQIQVDNVDDAITLMRMGANYNKKMAALKPNLKLIKMLEHNDLLDETKLSYLIDASKHDPGAITKLLKDANMDPLEIDTETSEYQPKDHQVNDSQFELDQILDDIKDNDSFPKTIDAISNQWDAKSKEIVLNDPRIITVIDEHVQSGVFDQIVSEMDKERMLGRLTDIPDIVAYKTVGDVLHQQGRFGQAPTEAKTRVEESTVDPKVAEERNARRKAAASTKGSKKSKPDIMIDPLSMSDEEFEKMAANGLYR